MRCVCHSFHIVASNALRFIPDEVEICCREIYAHFNCSAKRQNILKEFQEFCNVKPHKMLHPSQTRWLSLHAVIKRLIEQYNALLLYFAGTYLEDTLNKKQCEKIYRILEKPSTILYLDFLNFFLPLFTKLNIEMQSDDIKIHILYDRIELTLKTIADCFLKKEYLNSLPNIFLINLNNIENFESLGNLYLGPQLCSKLEDSVLTESEMSDFKDNCRNFLIKSCKEIIKRFDFCDEGEVFKLLKFVSPASLKNKTFSSLGPLSKYFSNVFSEGEWNELDLEYRSLRNLNLIDISTENVQQFWKNVLNIKFGDETEMFPHMKKLISFIFCLPHSGAGAERLFSAVNLNRTRLRNKLQNPTLSGILFTKALVKRNKCVDFEVEKDCVNLHNKNMYKN
ncbi:uncharacterized protein LOC129953478 isoform X1 [Eupeodes corollae]|uniref:uncharacterized protein LOC129953478 isoform X1 n=1 Tax=Eupeodes corollae TaxID=290404 RepID=UPI0024900391|nr:uncharacterized protein LOC129953478 isoform X1 [Eupeodes corollae]